MEKTINSVTELNNGTTMPIFGLGVYLAKEGPEVYNAIRWALDDGYTLVDTAAFYFNENSVGKAVKDSGIPREKLFITTKLWPQAFPSAQDALDKSLASLQMDYVDLYLMHWPGTDDGARLSAWDVMLENMQKGKVRACGVSNFYVHHLEQLAQHAGVQPANNQIELHPWQQQKEIRAYCEKNGISVTAWGPIFHGHLMEEPLVAQIGEKYGKSGAQVTLRWHLQHGINIIPKSVKKERIIENADIFDFVLSDGDMASIDALDGKGAFAFNSDLFSGDVDAYNKLVSKE